AMNMDFDASDGWYAALADYLSTFKKSDAEYRIAREKIAYLDIALPQRPSQGLIERIKSVFRAFLDGQLTPPAFSVTSTLPSVMNGGKDFCAWSAKDDLLYHTMRASVEGILGKDGVGLADLAICESKFEKGKDVAPQMLTLMGRLGEIQARGTPDIEFAVMGLWVRMQTMRGKAAEALKMLESLRDKYAQTGQGRFLPNLDALRCRIWLRLGNANAAQRWLSASAPRDEAKLRTMWRYQYLTRAMAQIANNR
ncbi:MAG: helix-turn-helix transcriptional regulator, partial [Clostridia bacterium]